MKANKKLLASAMALGLAGLTTVGSTYAWFSMNRTVSADGMKVNATTPASLVISQDSNVGTETSIKFDGGVTTLSPATHDETHGTTTKLAYITNGTDVDAETGYAESYTYADAVNDATTHYYNDFTMYIASSGSILKEHEIKATIFTNTEITTNSMFNAVTVDWYVDDTYVTKTNFVGATKDSADGSLTKDKYVKTEATAIASKDIPQAGNGSIKVTMRVYLDGALKNANIAEKETAYVTNKNVDITEFNLGVKFTAESKA